MSIVIKLYFLDEPHISPPTRPSIHRLRGSIGFVRVECGKNIEIVPSSLIFPTYLSLMCTISGSDINSTEIYKDGILIRDVFSGRYIFSQRFFLQRIIIMNASDIYGTYTFRLVTTNCGSDVAITRILRLG